MQGCWSAGTTLGSLFSLGSPSNVLTSLVAPAKPRPLLGAVGTRHQLGVTVDTPVVPAALAEAAGTGALLFTELMK